MIMVESGALFKWKNGRQGSLAPAAAFLNPGHSADDVRIASRPARNSPLRPRRAEHPPHEAAIRSLAPGENGTRGNRATPTTPVPHARGHRNPTRVPEANGYSWPIRFFRR